MNPLRNLISECCRALQEPPIAFSMALQMAAHGASMPELWWRHRYCTLRSGLAVVWTLLAWTWPQIWMVTAQGTWNALVCQGGTTYDFNRGTFCENASCPPCRILGYVVTSTASGKQNIPATLCFSHIAGTSMCPPFVGIVDCTYYPPSTPTPTKTATLTPTPTPTPTPAPIPTPLPIGISTSRSLSCSESCSQDPSDGSEAQHSSKSSGGSTVSSSSRIGGANGSKPSANATSTVTKNKFGHDAVVITCSSIGALLFLSFSVAIAVMQHKKSQQREHSPSAYGYNMESSLDLTVPESLRQRFTPQPFEYLPQPSSSTRSSRPKPVATTPSTFTAPRVVGGDQAEKMGGRSHVPDGHILVYGDESAWLFPEDDRASPRVRRTGDDDIVFMSDPESDLDDT